MIPRFRVSFRNIFSLTSLWRSLLFSLNFLQHDADDVFTLEGVLHLVNLKNSRRRDEFQQAQEIYSEIIKEHEGMCKPTNVLLESLTNLKSSSEYEWRKQFP